MTIGRRIGVAFGAILIGFALISRVAYSATVDLIENSKWVVHTHAVLEKLENVQRSANRAEASVLVYVISGDAAQADVFALAHERMNNALHELDRLTGDNEGQQRRVSSLRNGVLAFAQALNLLVRARQSGADNTALQQVAGSKYPELLDEVRRWVGAIREAEEQLLSQRQEQNAAIAQNSLNVIVWGGFAIGGICLLVAVLLTVSIVRPLRALLRGASELGSGNLAFRTVTGTSDELGVLGEAFNTMADNLGRTMVTAETEKRARGRIEGLLQTIAETASHLVSATNEIVAATTQQAAGAQEQVAAVTETVTTVNEVVQSSEQARERAHAVADFAAQSVRHGRNGKQVVQDSLQAMERVRELVERSAEGTLALAENAQAIGGVIESVTDIAEQTNILALNASIEASRSGQQGQTFRVVATEVKKLAEQSKSAAQNVREMLREVQTATSGLVLVAEECSKGVAVASKVIARADESIAALAETIDTASHAASQIAASAVQQATGTAQIHQAMKQISAVTVQNLSSTRQMEQAARDLNALGGRLRDNLGATEAAAEIRA
jgi:methyl-accepting chemotaxis protein